MKSDLEAKINAGNVKICLKEVIRKYIDVVFYGKKDIGSSGKKRSPQKSRSRGKLERSERQRSKENINVVGTPAQHTKSFYSVKKSVEKEKKVIKGVRKDGRSNSSFNRESPNEDVVKACQVIWQKTSQGDIKAMAKKYLQEVGRMPPDEKRVTKKEVLQESKQES